MNTKNNPVDFTKSINEYLNNCITVADAKIGAIIAVDIAIIGIIANTASLVTIERIAIIVYSLSLAAGLWALFPRLSSAGNSLIFWEDIRKNKSSETYYAKLEKLSESNIALEYSKQNFALSTVLHRKFKSIQASLTLFILASLILIAHVIAPLICQL